MIVPIVEGHAEQESVPLLVRRILYDEQIFRPRVRQGVRVPRDKLVKAGELERRVEFARRQPGARAIAVLIDADDACPKELGPSLLARGLPAASGLPLSVVLAKIELEAWFIAAIESLRGIDGLRENATSPDDPEGITDAKGWLTRQMVPGRTYVAVDNQAAFAQRFDYRDAALRSRSLRKFIGDVIRIGRAL